MKLVKHFLSVLLLCGSLSAFADTPETAFALRDGDRVVFYGDSITQGDGYTRFVENYARSRFPQWNLRFYNAGVGGDTVKGGWAGTAAVRLERDVIALKPTVVTIMLGMNDGHYRKFEPATLAEFSAGYRAIVAKLKESLPGVRLYLIRSTPFDDIARAPNFDPGYNDALRQLGDFVADLAREQGATVVDFGSTLGDGIRAVAQENRALAQQIIPDRVHPGTAGHFVMGATLLRAMHAPAIVTRVELDAKGQKTVAAENTAVTALTFADGKIAWTQLDRALPLPLNFGGNADTELAQKAHADLESLDQQPLVVAGLKPGRYELKIDDHDVGTFTDAELAGGVNLALHGTPMTGQIFPISWGVESGHEAQILRRSLLNPATRSPALAAAVDALAAHDEHEQSIRSQAALPKPHQYTLSSVP